ncbi:MAG: DUF1302 family protein [Mariprofundaceae bacterium]
MQRLFLSVWCFSILALVFSPAFAMEWTLHGALKNETAYFVSGDKRFDKVQNRLDLQPEAVLTDRLEFRGRFLSWYDVAMNIEPTNNTDLTAGIKTHYRTLLESKEAYFLYGGDDFDLRVGQQQIVWGKTDGLRLLDIINPLDLREFILDDFADSRIGLWALRLNYYIMPGDTEHELELVVTPDARVSELAPIGSRWGFTAPVLPVGITTSLLPADEPDWSFDNTELGAAWRAKLGGWDVSLNYLYGWKNTPNLEKQLTGLNLSIRPVYLRMHTAGGSFANAFGAWVVRGELAVNVGEAIDLQGLTPATSIEKMTTVNAALAGEWLKNNWTISPQVFVRSIAGWHTNVIEPRYSGFITLRVATDYMNERLKPEVIALYDWADGGWMIRPQASYEFADNLSGTLGLDIFIGSKGFFGQFAENDRVFTEIEWSF